jgi:hypothetical protein
VTETLTWHVEPGLGEIWKKKAPGTKNMLGVEKGNIINVKSKHHEKELH